MTIWNVSPEILQWGPLRVRWYGIFFALSFILGFEVIKSFFKAEKVTATHLDRLLIYMLFGTVIGARLGHVLFYEPMNYLSQPLNILKVWEGGLASHGAAIGILLSLYLFSKKYKLGYLWLTDRICIAVALAGGLIRLGNLFNSEIIGKPTSVPWAFVFSRVDMLPRHPTQIYESLTYFGVFGLLYWLYHRDTIRQRSGFLFGLFLVLVFSARLLIEFLKENQVSFESELPMDLGQLLSVPLILMGIVLLIRSRNSAPQGLR